METLNRYMQQVRDQRARILTTIQAINGWQHCGVSNGIGIGGSEHGWRYAIDVALPGALEQIERQVDVLAERHRRSVALDEQFAREDASRRENERNAEIELTRRLDRARR